MHNPASRHTDSLEHNPAGLLGYLSGDREAAFWDSFSRGLRQSGGFGMALVNAIGTVVFSNAFEENGGDWAGRHLNDVRPELWKLLLNASSSPGGEGESVVESGRRTWSVRVSPLRIDDNFVGALFIFEERVEGIPETREMRMLRERNRELDAIIRSSSDGIWVCDAEGRVIHVNPAAARINSTRAEDVVGRSMYDLVEEGFIDRSSVIECIRSRRTVSLLQMRAGRRLTSTATPVFDENGDLVRVVCSTQDVTELDTMRRELEEQEVLRDQFRHQFLEAQGGVMDQYGLIARSPRMVKTLQQAVKVSRVESTVLLLGESGVGKGRVADLIHRESSRSDRPMYSVNCGAIPESLIESELFGYEKGAFTGAQTSKPGLLEMADGGLLFLDEIGDLPQAAQVKMLRFLEDGKIMRLGDVGARQVDVRIIAATNRNLKAMVREGRFREDLFYRLNVIPLHIPALRERRDCILPLARHYIDHFGEQHGISKRLTPAATDALLAYHYPGNVRQLMNLCERLVVMSDADLIDVQDLPGSMRPENNQEDAVLGRLPEVSSLRKAVDDFERALLADARARYGSQTRMAAALGSTQATIARKMQKHGLR